MTGELFPLFPLRAVFFPGSALPSHYFVTEHPERVIPLLDSIESIDRIVRNDGYL
jgi:Lon protease-like protein